MGKRQSPSLVSLIRARGDVEMAIEAWKRSATSGVLLGPVPSPGVAEDATRAGERLNAFLGAVEKERELLRLALEACQAMASIDQGERPVADDVNAMEKAIRLATEVLKLANEPL